MYSAPGVASAPGMYFAPGVPGPPAPGSAPVVPASAASLAAKATFNALFQKPGLTTFGINLAVLLGSALVAGLLLVAALAASSSGSGLQVGASVSAVPVMMGFALGGGLHTEASSGFLSASMSLTMMTLGAPVAAGAGIFILSRRRMAVDGSAAPVGAVLLRAGAEALVSALIACLLTVPFSTSPDEDFAETSTGASFPLTLLVTLVVVLLALVLARAGHLLAAALPAPVVQAGRELAALGMCAAAVLGTVATIGMVIIALVEEEAWIILLIPVVLPSAVLHLLTLGSFGALSGQARGDAAELFSGMAPSADVASRQGFAWDLLGGLGTVVLFVAIAVVVLAAAARVGVRRARTANADLSRTWQLPAAVFAVGLVLMYMVMPIRVGGTVLGDRLSLSVGPAAWSILMVAALAALISVLAEYLPAMLYPGAASVLQLCAGKSALAAWLAGGVPQAGGWPGVQPRAQGGFQPGAVPGAVQGGFQPGAQGGFQPAAQAGAPAAQQFGAQGAAPGAAAGSLQPGVQQPVAQPVAAPLPVQPTAQDDERWIYGTDPATGAYSATDRFTGAVFLIDAAGQWVEAPGSGR